MRSMPEGYEDHFLQEETELFESGRCVRQTAYGMPWMEFCEAPVEDPDTEAVIGATLFCPEHRAERSG